MTAPRQVLAGATYLVTRRCTHRAFLLRPCKVVNEVFAYLLARAAKIYGVEVHAYCVLSNHFHLVVTDRQARLPAFQQYLDGLVARALNAHHGRWEHFWDAAHFSAVRLDTPNDIVAKAAYTLANPVAAGLVRRGREWPGLWSPPESLGATVQVRRPEHFFSKKGHLPETLDLKLTAPPGFPTVEAFREALVPALAALEAAAQVKVRGFLGAKRVLAQRPTARPPPSEPRRTLSPRVAARDRWKRLELLERLEGFLADYREALDRWRNGRRPIFPAGTYLMRVMHRVPCAAAG